MIKNKRHSHAAKMLARARELYKVYQNNLELAKYNLQVSRFDPYDRYSFHYNDDESWYDSAIFLPKGSIKKLIGKDLTWEDEPVELKED